MFLTVGDVVGRYLVGIIPGLGPIPGSFELTEFMLAVIVLTAIGHTQMKDEHISIDLLVEKFSPKGPGNHRYGNQLPESGDVRAGNLANDKICSIAL